MAKKVYGLDYPITLYATVYVEANDAEEAASIGERMLDSQRFIDEELVPRWGDFPYYGDNIEGPYPFEAEEDDVLDVDEYIKE